MSKEVTIYSKSHCPYCVKAKQLFKAKNISFKEIDVGSDEALLAEMISKSGGRKTVPQIFIGSTHVGGCDDLMELNDKNQLNNLLLID